MKDKIYAVMVTGANAPGRTYTDYSVAETEAKRLSRSTAKTTYVLQAIAIIELTDVTVTKLNIGDNDGI